MIPPNSYFRGEQIKTLDNDDLWIRLENGNYVWHGKNVKKVSF